jgi:hypothetical protein
MMHELISIFHCLKRQLLAACEEELGALDATDREFVAVIGALRFGPLLQRYEWCGHGAKPHPRVWLAHAPRACINFPRPRR